MALGIMKIQWRFKIGISWDLREMLISHYIYPNIYKIIMLLINNY